MGGGGGVEVKSDACETPINGNTQEGINFLLEDAYRVEDDGLLYPENTPINTGITDQPLNKEVWKWNVIYHRRTYGCQRYAEKLYGISK